MGEGSEAAHFHADKALKAQDEKDRVKSGGLIHFARSDGHTLDSRGELSHHGINECNLTAAELKWFPCGSLFFKCD